MAERPVLIFLHVPKACGTTLNRVLERWFDPARIYAVGRKPAPQIREELAELSSRQPRGVDLITGHAPFGLHTALAAPARYITVLREPVERVISTYEYIRRTPEHRLHEEAAQGRLTLLDVARRFSNWQTRYIGGDLETPATEETLARAIGHLEEHFPVTGVAERFDETVVLLHREFQRALRPFASENVGVRRVSATTLPGEELREVERHCEFDRRHYEFVRQRFAAQIAAQDRTFPLRVAALQTANRVGAAARKLLRK